ncbi:MAG: acyl carrier protein [Rhodoferax sp.]|nr:acyl carrier protein [Rhodoferax sp.]
MQTTLSRLQQILTKDYPLAPEALTRAARLEDLGIDSLATAELLFTVEDTFHLALPNEVVPLATLGDVVDYIDRIAAAQAGQTPPGVAPERPVLAP